MEQNTFSLVLLGLQVCFGAIVWFMKDAYSRINLRVEKLESNTVKRDDFKEFKEELFRRLDRMEAKINHD